MLEVSVGLKPTMVGLQPTALVNLATRPYGTRGRIQTYDLPLRRRLLLFAELLGYMAEEVGVEPNTIPGTTRFQDEVASRRNSSSIGREPVLEYTLPGLG